jgi:hypothetical protein
MTLFHVDIILYLVFLLLNTYNNKEQLLKDLDKSLLYFGIFAFCIFLILFAMIKEFPTAMFFFICFALMRATRQFIFQGKR